MTGRSLPNEAGAVDRQARRNVLQDPGEQRGRIGRHAWRRRKRLWILGGHAIDDRQAGLDRRAVAGIDAPLDRRREDDAPAFLQADEGVAPGRMIGREAGASDRDQPSAVGKAGERRRDMAQGGVRDGAVDMCRDRERRVHQHHARPQRAIEMVVDVSGVMPGDRARPGKSWPSRPARASASSFKTSPLPASSAKMASKPVPAEGSSTRSAGRDRGRRGGNEGELDRRRELLQCLALLGSACMGGQKSRDLAEHLQ